MASCCDELVENQELEIGENWLNFDSFKMIRTIVESYHEEESKYYHPILSPQKKANLKFSQRDQSSSGYESENRKESISQNSFLSFNTLEQRFEETLECFELCEKRMWALVELVSMYLDLPENLRKSFDHYVLLDEFENMRIQYCSIQEISSIMCFDYRRAAGDTVDAKHAEEAVNRILIMNTTSGAKFEKFVLVGILLKAQLENFRNEKKVSESLARLEIEVEQMPNWNCLKTEVSSDDSS